MYRTRTLTACALAFAALTMGCAEVPPLTADSGSQFVAPGMDDLVRTDQAVTLRTRFVLAGVETVDPTSTEDVVALSQLFVNVGAIFLDPADDSSVAFSSRNPFELNFDAAAGTTDIYGPELQLPVAGDFFVSIQVEPNDVVVSDDKADDAGHSLVVHGEYTERSEVDLAGDEPSPLPWEPKDMQSRRSLAETHDFTYRSSAVARIQLGEIQLREKGAYELVLTVNVADWLRDDVLPAVRVHVETAGDDAEVPERFDEAVDFVESVVDDEGAGVHSLVGDIGIGTRQY